MSCRQALAQAVKRQGRLSAAQVAHDLSFLFAHGRDADLDLGYAGPGRRGDLQLLSMAESHARGLLTVTQRRCR